jgi:CheY-like chemotaxis protein
MTRNRLQEIESLEELEERRFERRLGEEHRGPRRGVNVLIVESDEAFRELFVAWLSDAGLNVQACPGPQEPEFECAGASRYGCPLADASDLVVLDLELESDLLLCGVAAWELLHYYRSLGRPVVVLSGTEDALTPVPGDRIAVLRRPPEHDSLIDAVRVLLLLNELHPDTALESVPDVVVAGTGPFDEDRPIR